MMNLNLAMEIVGGLSKPSKMPCHGFSIPAEECKTGAKLRHVKNTICSKCYALKGRYVLGVVKKALRKRFENMNHPLWCDAMAFLIRTKEKSGFFRWFDSGDIQSVEQLRKIVTICDMTQNVQHWLPTREYRIVREYIQQHGPFPSNLTVRLSAYLIDGPPPVSLAKDFRVTTSGVVHDGFTCPASLQGGKCLDCRACWNPKVANVNYKVH